MVRQRNMNFKYVLNVTGVNELKEKVEQADMLLNKLKNILNEISDATIDVALSPVTPLNELSTVIRSEDLIAAINRSTNNGNRQA
jgi:hypothetical protein